MNRIALSALCFALVGGIAGCGANDVPLSAATEAAVAPINNLEPAALALRFDAEGRLLLTDGTKLDKLEDIRHYLTARRTALRAKHANHADVSVILDVDAETQHFHTREILITCQEVGFRNVQIRVRTKNAEERIAVVLLGDKELQAPAGPKIRVQYVVPPRGLDSKPTLTMVTPEQATEVASFDKLPAALAAARRQLKQGDLVVVEIDPEFPTSRLVDLTRACQEAGYARFHIDIEALAAGCLENEIGSDTDVPSNYSVDRIEEVVVPGPVEVKAAPAAEKPVRPSKKKLALPPR